MDILIVDVESTCWDNDQEKGNQTSEIIEIGYTPIINGKAGKPGSIFIKPEYSKLSGFCTKLTSITSELLNEKGLTPKEGYQKLASIMNKFDTWGSWGFYDLNQIKRMFELYHINDFLPKKHINVRQLYAEKIYDSDDFKKAPNNPADAMHKVGLSFKGVNHRGSDDTFNIARIYEKLVGKKVKDVLKSVFKV